MKAKIKKFTESNSDISGSIPKETTNHVGRGALDSRADFIEPDTKVEEDAGAPSAISTSSSVAALSSNPTPVGGFDQSKKVQGEEELEEAHYSYVDNVQVPGEVQSNPTGSRMLGNAGETLEEENYGNLGANGDGGRLGAMHSLNQQAFANFNSDTSQNLQSYDQTNQDIRPSQTYTNSNNALVGVSDGEDPTLLSTTNDIGGKTGLNKANQQTLINKDHYPAANSDTIQAVDTQEHEKELLAAGSYAHESDETKLESLILSRFPHHDLRFMQVFDTQYNSVHGKQKIQGKFYESSFVLKHGDYYSYFLEYMTYFSKEESSVFIERYEDQNRVDKYPFITNKSGDNTPNQLEEEIMEDFNLDNELDTEDEVKDDIESSEGNGALDILTKVADGALSPEDAIEELKAAMEKDEEDSTDLDLDADASADEDLPEEEEEVVEESGMPTLATEEVDVAKSHAQAVVESKAKAAKPAAKKPVPKAVAKKPVVKKAAPKKGLKESRSKAYVANFYYVYSNGKVVDFGQAARVTESLITLVNGKSYNLEAVTLTPMRGW